MNAHIHAQLANVAVADRLRAAERARTARDAGRTGDAIARHRRPRIRLGVTVGRRLRVPARARMA
jgi:hypothetical protein